MDMRKILICGCVLLAGLFCAAGCGSTAAEGESAGLTDTALTGEGEGMGAETGETESTQTEAREEKGTETEIRETEADSNGNGEEKKSAGDAEGREAGHGQASAEWGDADVDSDAMTGTEDDAVLEFPGALSVAGTRLVGSSGNPVQLRGISTHGLAWYPDYVNEECFRQLKEEWGADIVRLAMYTAESGGYCTDGNREELKTLVKDGVEYATDCGLYVIIDWHILSDGNPNTHLEEAKDFFGEMSEEYAEYDNVFYEICNEPNGGTSWSEVKRYAEEIVPVIRANDGEGIILVGTPNWCQYVDQAAADPIIGYDNIMYTLHFYAATHTDSLRAAMVNAVEAGLPIFVSEYGICDASGNGAIDTAQADRWVEAMDEYGISYVAWNLSNKSESSALLKSGCGKISGFGDEDLSDSGRWLRGMLDN